MVSRVPRFLCLLAALAASLCSGLHAQTPFAQPAVVKTGNWPANLSAGFADNGNQASLVECPPYSPGASMTCNLYRPQAGRFTPAAQYSVSSAIFMKAIVVSDPVQGVYGVAVLSVQSTASAVLLRIDFYPNGTGTAMNTTAVISGTAAPKINDFAYRPSPNFAAEPGLFIATDGANGYVYLANLGSTSAASGPVLGTLGSVILSVSGPDPVLGGEILPNLYPITSAQGKRPAFGLVATDGAAVGFIRTNPDGTLNPIVPGAGSSNAGVAHSALLADMDGDGVADLLIEGANGQISIYQGITSGQFSPASEGGTGTSSGLTGVGGHLVAVADLNHDGRPDIVTATPAGISVLLGQGNLTYVLEGVYNAGPGRSSYALADFNGDGNLDLAVDSPEGVAILYGNADGSFQSGRAFPTQLPASSGALGAFTKSGNLDAVAGLSSTEAQVLLGQGDGTFVPVGGATSPVTSGHGVTGLPPSYIWSTVGVGDFDGDGSLDLATLYDGPWGQPTLWTTSALMQFNLGRNNGHFDPAPFITQPPSGLPPAYGTGVTGQFLGDGSSGVANLIGQNLQVTTRFPKMYGQALITFADYSDAIGVAYASDIHAHNLTVAGDLNHDGADDLVVQHNGLLTVYLSTKDGQFKKVATTVPVAPYVSNTWGGVSQTYNEPAFPGSMAIADLNGDGFGDLVVAYDDMGADHTQPTASRPNHVLVWLGNGDGTFHGPTTIVPSRNFYQIALADLNGDGHPDLVMHDGYVLSVQYGKGDGTFGAEQHYLAGMGLNTISAGDLNHDGKVDLVVANGGTFFGNPVANHEAPVANPEVNSGGITVLLNTQAATLTAATGTLTATPNPVAYDGDFTVTIALNGTPAPTGTVAFTIDGVPAGGSTTGSATLTNGAVTLSFPASSFTTPLTPGAHALMAVYAGDANYTGVTLKGTLTVGLAPTSVTLTPTTPLQVYFGQGIDGLFSVIATFPITGTYTVLDNGVPTAICTNLPFTVNGVRNDCPYGNPVLLDAGPHSLSVAYNGDSENAPSVSPSLPYVVLPDVTTASLTSSVNPSTLGQPVTFTATVAGNAAVPVGPINFVDGTTVLGTVVLNAAGVASFVTSSLTVGTHPIRAVYAGTLDFNAASSGVLNQVVNPLASPLATAIQLTSSLNPAPAGFGLIFTATVVTSGSFSAIPSGAVSFLDGGAVIGTGTLNTLGVATFATSTLTVGSHAMTASYAGLVGSSGGLPPPSPPKPPVQPRAAYAASSQTLLASVSPVLTQVITTPLKTFPPSFSVSVTPDPVYVPAGQDAVLAVRVVVEGNFTQTVQLGCTGLPAEASCIFATPTIGAAGGTTTLYVLPQGPHGCGTNGAAYYGLIALFGLVFAPRRRRLGLLLAAVCLFGLVGLSGCGSGCTDLGVIPGNYNFIVTGTPSAGSVTGVQGWTVGMKVTLP